MHAGRPANDLLHDTSIPVDVKKAIRAYIPWLDWHTEAAMAAGSLVPFTHSDGTVSLYESTSGVFAQRAKAEAAQQRYDAATAKSDELLNQAHALDGLIAPKIGEIAASKRSISGVIGMSGSLDKVKIRQFSRLAGNGGLLDQIDAAFKAQDWVALRDASRKASNVFNTKGAADWMNVKPLADLKANLDSTLAYAKARATLQIKYQRAYYGTAEGSKKVSTATLELRALKAQKDFLAYVRAHPAGEWTDVVKREFQKAFLASDKAEILMDLQAAGLKESMQLSPEGIAIVNQLRSNPQKLREVVTAYSDPTFHSPFIPDMTPGDHKIFMNTALKEVDLLRARGVKPMYVPTLSPKDINAGLVSDRIAFKPNKTPTIGAAHKKTLDMSSTVNDVMLGVDKATKDLLERDAKLETFREILLPMLTDGTSLKRAIIRDNLANITADTSGTALASVESLIRDHYGLSTFDIKRHTSLDPTEFSLDPKETYYLPQYFGDQMTKMFDPKSPTKIGGLWDKSTGVFKYSILGLSPRYTAHIAFGGTMLLVLRVHPRAFMFIGKAVSGGEQVPPGGDIRARPRGVQGSHRSTARPTSRSTTRGASPWPSSPSRSGWTRKASTRKSPPSPSSSRPLRTSTSASPTTSPTSSGLSPTSTGRGTRRGSGPTSTPRPGRNCR